MIEEGNPFKLKTSTHSKLVKIMKDIEKRDKEVIYFDDMLNHIINEYAKNHRIQL